MARGASGIKAGRAYVELGVDDRLSKALRAAQAKLKAFGASVRNVGLGLTGAAAAAAAPLVASVKTFAQLGDSIEKASARTGMSAEAISELGFAAEQSGADVETLERGVRVMQRSMVEAAAGGGAAREAFDELVLSAAALLNLSPDEQFAAIAERVAQVADPARRAAIALKLFGRSGGQLIPLLSQGAAGIEALRGQARAFGISISGPDAKAAAVLTDTLNLLNRAVRGLAFRIGSALAPLATTLAERMARVVAAVNRWVAANKPLVVWTAKVIAVVGGLGAALVGLGLSISLAGAALGGFATAFGIAMKAVLVAKGAVLALLSPLGLVTLAVAGVGGAIIYYSGSGARAIDWLRGRFGELADRVSEVIGAVGDALKAGDIGLAARVAWLGIKAEWVRGTGFLRDLWTNFRGWFIGTWLEVTSGVELFAVEAWHAFEVGAAEAFAFVLRGWNNLTSFMRRIWESVTGWFADRLIDVMGVFDDSLDVEAAKSNRRQADDSTIAEIDRRQEEESKAIESRLAERRASATGALAARKDAIGTGLIESERRIAAERDAALAETVKSLAKAQEELRGAMEEARKAREAVIEGEGPRKVITDALDGLDASRARAESRGIFSAAAIQSLQSGAGSSRPLERIAKASEETAKGVAALLRKASGDGLVFTE